MTITREPNSIHPVTPNRQAGGDEPPGSPSLARLYFRGTDQEYADDRSVDRPVASPGIVDLHFTLPGGTGTVAAVRLQLMRGGDPIAADFVKMYRLAVRVPQEGRSRTLIAVDDFTDTDDRVRTSGLMLDKDLLGGCHRVVDEDPGVEVVFPEPESVADGSRMQVDASLEYLPNREYVRARDCFLVDQERLQLRIRELEARVAELEPADAALQRYRASPLWRWFAGLDRCYRRLGCSAGAWRSASKLVDPAWWKRRRQTDYERWRSARQLQNRGGP